MTIESAPAAQKTDARTTPEESNLLDMAKERALRRAERQKQRIMRQATRPLGDGVDLDDENALGNRVKPTQAPAQADALASIMQLPKLPKKRHKRHWSIISFAVAALLPTLVTALYFAFIASPQFEVEAQFAVRGAQQSSLNSLGLSALVSSSAQAGDSYVVTDYIHSTQILQDMKDQAGLDVREIYSRSSIDFFYKQNESVPFEEFRPYWRDMVNVSYNSTTGNVTLQVYAFSAQDATRVAEAILTVSEKLVNTLSEKSRDQFIGVATAQVTRSEDRLRAVRGQLTQLRSTEQAVDPTALATMESTIIATLEQELASLRTRYKALIETVSTDSPNAKGLERQITAIEAQLTEQKARVGEGSGGGETIRKTSRNGEEGGNMTLPEVLDRFAELTIEQEFAVKAYTASLASLETALQDAQKQERYFATYVLPRQPEIAIYPRPFLNTFLAFLTFTCLWLIGYFGFRSVKDHAI